MPGIVILWLVPPDELLVGVVGPDFTGATCSRCGSPPGSHSSDNNSSIVAKIVILTSILRAHVKSSCLQLELGSAEVLS